MVRFLAERSAGHHRQRGHGEAIAINPTSIDLRQKAEASLAGGGGELINLPPDEQTSMMQTLSSVGADVSKSKPELAEAYRILTDAAQRTRQSSTQ